MQSQTNWRPISAVLFLVLLTLFILGFAILTLQFSLPKPKLVEIGLTSEFPPSKVFIDPSTGAQFNLYGEPVRWSKQSLPRYPVRIIGDQLWVDITQEEIDTAEAAAKP